MAYEFITVEKADHITTLTINRPEVMNALHPPCCFEMDEALNEFADNANDWVCILTGAGDRAFSAGDDLKWQALHGGEAVFEAAQRCRGGYAGIASRFDCYKPIIAAVNGVALGGGFDVALSCDLIIAAEHARFGLPEPRVGTMAMGSVQRLIRRIPYYHAMGVVLTGRMLPAEEAHGMGLVNEVVPHGDLIETAHRWASQIVECAPLAIRASKEAAIKGASLPLDEAIAQRLPTMREMFASDDFAEGPRAFAGKRKPSWKGR
jgi:crotonobetainyl-CoA hydratase